MALTAKKVYAILKRQISDMEAKLNSPVRYRGTVATADLLPLNPDIGDMYNIESKSVYGEAGMNVAWNGVVWDTMGAPIDMSLYIKSSELADWVKQQNKPAYTAEEVGALPADTKIPSKTSDLQNDSGFLTKIPDNYLSGTDKTLSVSGKAADAKAVGDKNVELLADILSKLDKNQGSENFGKIAGINESGDIVPMFPVSVDYNEETNCLEFGSDQKMELNKGINLDSTLTKTGYAADAGAVGEITNSLKEDLGNCIRIANYTRLTPVFDKKGLYWSCNQDYKLCVLYANEYKEAKVYEVHKGKRYTVCGMSDGNSTSPLVIFSKTYPTVKGETSRYENFIAGSNSESRITTEKHITSPIDGYMLITSSTVYGGYAIEESVKLIIDDRYGLYVSDGCYTTFSKIGNNTYLCRIFKNVYINQLFDFNGCYIGKFDEYGELYKYKDFGTFPSDVVGPIAIRENDWSATTKFSGGSHGIEISGTNYPTAKQKTLLVKCDNKTIDTDGYYIGQTEFVSKNILYIPMTITDNDLSSAKEGIEETRRYCINDVLSVSVDYNMLTDIIADVLYGFQLQIYGMEEITLPNNEVKVSVNQEQNYVFKKPENKYICTNENGDYCSVEMSTCGLGDFLKNNGESVTKYGYISAFKNPNKIYFQLINHGVQLATGKTLHWDAICNHRPH